MKFISWNVNGLRAVVNKGFKDIFSALDADFFCLQETKLQEGQIDLRFEGYESYWNYAEKKGYSGTAIFTKHTPLNVSYGIGIEEHDREGRVITLEYADFFLVTVYTPNSRNELKRLDYRMQWEDDFLAYIKSLDEKNAGFTDEERRKMTAVLSSGFTDTWRSLNPDTEGVYSWWSYRFNARKNNAGWRIDYFIVSDRLMDKVDGARIHTDIMGSDHCPVELDISL